MNKNKILIFIILFLIPIATISFLAKLKKNELYSNVKSKTETQEKVKENKTEESLSSPIKINVLVNNTKTEMNLEEYIVGVLAGEMPATFEEEALKAQAVAARTYAMYKINNTTEDYDVIDTINDQVYLTKEKMQENWQDKYEENYHKLFSAVKVTENQVLEQNGQIIKAFFFSMSNGYTEDSLAVFREGNIKSVESKWDNASLDNFEVTTNFSKEELKEKLNLNTDEINIKVLARSNTNHVTSVEVNSKTMTGIEFRKALNLRSTDFTIIKNNNGFSITTKGNGHGVGMSQYGANGMAKEGYTYDEILKYYYNDIEIAHL